MASWFDAGSLDEIADPGARGFEVPGLQGVPFFVVRKAGDLRAYRNRCPHTGAPLEWQPHQFLDIENGFIQCAIHGALFRIGSGRCVRGPCVNQSLQPLPIEVHEGRIRVDVAPLFCDAGPPQG